MSRSERQVPLSVRLGLVALTVDLLATTAHDLWRSRFDAVSLLWFVLWGGLLFLIFRRRNWARMVYAATVVIFLPLALVTLFPYFRSKPFEAGFVLVMTLIEVFGLVCLFRRSSSEWFRHAAA